MKKKKSKTVNIKVTKELGGTEIAKYLISLGPYKEVNKEEQRKDKE